eukprot:1188831-Prorocentrum_minimum.AAC.1
MVTQITWLVVYIIHRLQTFLTFRGLLPGTPRRGIASQERIASLRSLRSDGPEIRPGVGARPGNVKESLVVYLRPIGIKWNTPSDKTPVCSRYSPPLASLMLNQKARMGHALNSGFTLRVPHQIAGCTI